MAKPVLIVKPISQIEFAVRSWTSFINYGSYQINVFLCLPVMDLSYFGILILKHIDGCIKLRDVPDDCYLRETRH